MNLRERFTGFGSMDYDGSIADKKTGVPATVQDAICRRWKNGEATTLNTANGWRLMTYKLGAEHKNGLNTIVPHDMPLALCMGGLIANQRGRAIRKFPLHGSQLDQIVEAVPSLDTNFVSYYHSASKRDPYDWLTIWCTDANGAAQVDKYYGHFKPTIWYGDTLHLAHHLSLVQPYMVSMLPKNRDLARSTFDPTNSAINKSGFTEVVAEGRNKAANLLEIADITDLTPTFAIGDDLADAPMMHLDMLSQRYWVGDIPFEQNGYSVTHLRDPAHFGEM